MLGLGLARHLPRPVRVPLIRLVEGARILRVAIRIGLAALIKALRDRAWRDRPSSKSSDPEACIAIVGLFATRTGLGQGARLLAASLEKQGRDIARVDVTRHFTAQLGLDPAFLGQVPRRPSCPTVVICLNPPEFLLAYLALPLRVRLSARVIGYWAWELERLPQGWLRSMPFADEIWVPSRFVADAVTRALPAGDSGKVRVVPHDVAALPLGPRRTDDLMREARRRHGLDEAAFTIGYSFAIGSNYARKNPVAAVEAFKEAFPTAGSVKAHLLIRCNEAQAWPTGITELEDAIGDDARITLAINAEQKPSILDFYHMLDCYLSLHRSEGYGLNLAEAACLGVPVIATGWGLAEDIAAMPDVATVSWQLVPVKDPQEAYTGLEAVWAEPNVAEAVALLRQLERHSTR